MTVLEEVAKMQEEDKQAQATEPVKEVGLVASQSFSNENEMMSKAVTEAGKQAKSLKDVVDVGVTGKALMKDGVLDELTAQKEAELKEDALAKVIASEAERIKRETAKLTEEGKKQLAQLQNEIHQAEAEKDKIEKQADKNLAYFNSHKSILKYAGCKEAMSLQYMQTMAVIGFVVMCIVKVLFSPLILVGQFIELLMDIIGGVTEKIKANALKIVVSVLLFIFIAAIVVGCYYGIVKLVG